MRERVLFSDLTTLYVCPTERWGTLERKALSDCLIQRDFGGNPLIFCLKGSKLDIEADKWDIRTVHYTGKKVKSLVDLRFLFDLWKILKQNDFNIVHCYDLDFLWAIALLLIPKPQVPLLLTFNSYLYSAQKEFWQKWLFRRVDQVLVFSQTMKEVVQETLPVSNRKVKISGNGVESIKRIPHEVPNQKIIGCIVTSEDDLEQVKTLIFSMKGLIASTEDLLVDIKLNIYSMTSIEKFQIYESVTELVHENQLNDIVHFHKVSSESEAMRSIDFFVGTAFNEPFNDYEVMAILSKIPVLLPRTASRQFILNHYKWTGESFYYSDSREVKAKLLKMIINDRVYLNELEDQNQSFQDRHGLDAYVTRLCGFYERNYTKRLRYKSEKTLE